MSLSDLEGAGFDIQTVNHALAVLTKDFPEPLEELCGTLLNFRIADVELIKGGGGEADSTQRLRRSLTEREWIKRNIVIRKTVDDIERAAISHEIDHVRRTDNGAIALEIEWNEPLAKQLMRAGFPPDSRLLRWDRPTLPCIMGCR